MQDVPAKKKRRSGIDPTVFFVVESKGVEPLTSCLQGRRSSQLS